MKIEWTRQDRLASEPRPPYPRRRRKMTAALCAAALAGALGVDIAGCLAERPPDAPNVTTASPDVVATPSPFVLKPEWQGPCARSETVDVNIGNAPESFVKAAYCQITGQPAPAATVEVWSKRLREDSHVRRI